MRRFAFLALIALAACGLSTSGTLDETGDDAGTEGTGPSGPGPLDATADGSLGDGALPPDDVGVVPTPDAPRPDVCADTEICTDGIDNDCNGAADCADPACGAQGFACVPHVPAGFGLVAFDATHRNACPTGYGSPADLVVDPNTAPATCRCMCSMGASPSCVSGGIEASFGPTSACGAGSGTYTNVNGACAPVDFTFYAYVNTTRLKASGGSCQSNATTNVDNSFTQGRTCSSSGPYGIGCSGGGVCAPGAPATFRACVAQAGDVACSGAGAYTKKHDVGTSVTDTRGCSTCTCASPTATCTNSFWNQYTSNDCSGTPVALTADGNCDLTNAGTATYRSSKYVATMQSPSCASPAPPTATGALTITGRQTVCCTP